MIGDVCTKDIKSNNTSITATKIEKVIGRSEERRSVKEFFI